MTTDILALAARVIELDASQTSTSAPWTASHDFPVPPTGCCVADAGLDDRGVPQWVAASGGGTRGTPSGDASLIAEYRSAAPDLARFAKSVDEATRAIIADHTGIGDDQPEWQYLAAAEDIRARLGLPRIDKETP